MPLNIIEASLDKVKPEYHDLYVKKDGSYQLNLSDLSSHVDAHLKPLRSELDVTRAFERKNVIEHGLSAALRKANVLSDGHDLLVERLGKRVVVETEDDKRVVRITEANGETPMVGTGVNGSASFDDLVKEAAKRFPSMFRTAAPGGGEMPSSGAAVRARSDFQTEKERADFVSKHGLDAYNKLPAGRSRSIGKKSDFASEKQRASWVDRHGIAAYHELPD